MSKSQTQLRFSTSRRDGTVDLICNEDAEVALVSLACEPDPLDLQVTAQNSGIWFSVWAGEALRKMTVPLQHLNSKNIVAWFASITDTLYPLLKYPADLGLRPSFGTDKHGALTIDRFYDQL